MKSFRRIASFVLAFLLFAGSTAISANAASRTLKTGIAFVNASSLRMRSEPTTASKTLDYAYRNEVVVILAKVGSWYKVSYNLQTGYMHGNYLNVTTRENAELGYGRVNGTNVNIRSGPGTGYGSQAKANTGDTAYIIGINNQWFKIIYGDIIGYIRSDYMDLTEIPYENRDSQNKPLFFRGGKSTGITPSAAALKGTSSSDLAQEIIATAKQYIGVPYVYGGSTPKGFDCSGYVKYVFNLHGMTLPRSSKQQWSVGTSVAKANLKPGDLVFFQTSGNGVSHSGIYIGDGQFIHASSSRGVMISALNTSYWVRCYYGAKRVLS